MSAYSHIVICNIYTDMISFLENHNIPTITFAPCDDVSTPVRGHSDLFCHYLGNNTAIVYYRCTDLILILKEHGYNVIIYDIPIGKSYPNDVSLNAFAISNHMFCNTKTITPVISEYYKKHDYLIHHTSQGYTNCSCIKISDNAMITSDLTISTIASSLGIDTLYVSPVSISLPPYPHGFIGGCGAMVSDNLLMLSGDVKSHTDYASINSFLKKHRVTVICNSSPILMDYGLISCL